MDQIVVICAVTSFILPFVVACCSNPSRNLITSFLSSSSTPLTEKNAPCRFRRQQQGLLFFSPVENRLSSSSSLLFFTSTKSNHWLKSASASASASASKASTSRLFSQKQTPKTMADNIVNDESNPQNSFYPSANLFSASSSSCPCCSFLSYNDLFLPPGEKGGEQPYEKAAAGLNERAAASEKNGNDAESSNIMISPHDALEQIIAASHHSDVTTEEEGKEIQTNGKQLKRVLLVDTHSHPHLDRERQAEYIPPSSEENENKTNNSDNNIICLSCAVAESDWTTALQYASQSKSTLPGLGVHPWYLADLSPSYLQDLEELLLQHPSAIVGEIGLCKMAKFVRTYSEGKTAALELQRRVFKEQMILAAKLRRPVSVHCVKQHGVFLSVLKEMKEEANVLAKERRKCKKDEQEKDSDLNSNWCLADAFPPAIGMHSFTGTAHHVKEILAFEDSLLFPESSSSTRRKKSRKKSNKKSEVTQMDSNGDDETKETTQRQQHQQQQQEQQQQEQKKPIFYFGFSHSINVLMCSSDKSRRQGQEAICAAPTNRLLAESDVHSHRDVAAGTAGAIANIAAAIELPLVDTAALTAKNGLQFFGSLGQ